MEKEKTVEPDRPQTIWHMRIACWINKATKQLTSLNLLLHVSTYISHHSGVPMNPDYLQSAFAHLGSQTSYSFRTHTM